MTESGGRSLVLGLVSNLDEIRRDLESQFTVRLIDPDRDGSPAERVDIDIYLVEVMAAPRLGLVAELALERGMPVVVYGPRNGTDDALAYLDAGASDYLYPSMVPSERAARIRAAARRIGESSRSTRPDLTIGDVSVDLGRHEVTKQGRPVRLTPNEFKLLEVLMNRAGATVSHRELMGRVWGAEHLSARHHLRVFIRQLRGKLEDDPNSPRLILTEWGAGYRLATDAEAQERAGGAASA